MRILDSKANLRKQGQKFVSRKLRFGRIPPLAEFAKNAGEGPAANSFHREEFISRIDAKIVERDNSRVFEAALNARFSKKPRSKVFSLRLVPPYCLDSHVATNERVMANVNVTHAAPG
jgi:hypothetical protein